jgi:hypothetical protein
MATSTSVSRPEYPIIISRWLVRVLPAPPRSPAKRHLPGATGIALDFPRLCRPRRGIVRVSAAQDRSLSPKMPARSLASPNHFPAEFSVANRDGFECRRRLVRVLNALARAWSSARPTPQPCIRARTIPQSPRGREAAVGRGERPVCLVMATRLSAGRRTGSCRNGGGTCD